MSALVVLGMLGALLAGLHALRHRLGAETRRKALHALMGCALVGLPLLNLSVAALGALAGAALVLLGALRVVPALRARWGAVLHGVARASWGELCFPAAVFVATQAAPSFRAYAAALLVLALADTAAAFAGLRWPRGRFRAWGGTKTLAGSLACFGVSLLVCVPLLGWMGVAAALAATVAEAATGRGFDNLAVPLLVLVASAVPGIALVLSAALAVLLAVRQRRAPVRRRPRPTRRGALPSYRRTSPHRILMPPMPVPSSSLR